MNTKVCPQCGEEKPIEEFRLCSPKGRTPFRYTYCPPCSSDYGREQRNKNPLVYHLYTTKHRAKKLGVPFDLTPEDIEVPDVCPVLGIPIERGSGGSADGSPSIDRIDPNGGYVKGNVIVISQRANTIKQNATCDEVQAVADWMRKVGAP